ncbi:hypothetical protein K505DRAFT_364190 [Melanomma pulvis-pyrius CBS 109.77]|uniref:Uncharacterized protein n=1 Tax=Melanomma pulvis-pyrius CBS 109.77 TaxID=1314802 RepID=A0A6A6X463_9PLEO|nr:hypothetical protein K505DRAFT_364190 [Melanomma pulvis-pyrius CBS 109.77]
MAWTSLCRKRKPVGPASGLQSQSPRGPRPLAKSAAQRKHGRRPLAGSTAVTALPYVRRPRPLLAVDGGDAGFVSLSSDRCPLS